MQRIRAGDLDVNVVVRGCGPPLLFVHGFPFDHTMWRQQIDVLSSSYHVIAPDLRGFGQTDVTSGVVTMEQMADDLAVLLDALDVGQSATLCGLSMGGYVAFQFWQRHPSRLDRLILCDTRAIADTQEMVRFRIETADRVLKEGTSFLIDAMSPKLFAPSTHLSRVDTVEWARGVIRSTDPRGIAAALRGMAERPDVTEMLGDLDLPTLVICGQHDEISTVDEMRGIAKAIPGARFVEIADAGHMAPVENPDAVNAAIGGFFDQ